MSARNRHAREGTVATSQQRHTEAPTYQQLEFPLNAKAQSALEALLRDPHVKELENAIAGAQSILADDAEEINERMAHKKNRTEKLKRRQQDYRENDQENDPPEYLNVDFDQSLRDFQKSVESKTKQIGSDVKKLVDAHESLNQLKAAITATAHETRANGNLPNTQLRSQRTVARGSRRNEDEDDEDDEEQEQYQEFQPTDPSGGTQTPIVPSERVTTLMETAKLRHESQSLVQRYGNSKEYVDFMQRVHEIQYPDGDVPLGEPHQWFNEASAPGPGVTGRGDDDDDDLAVTRSTTSIRCPLTLREFTDPLTSKNCPHSFEREAILDMIRHSGGRGSVRCPVPGCDKTIARNDLEVDRALIRRIKRLQRAKELEEDDDVDENALSGSTQRPVQVGDNDDDGADVDAIFEQTQQAMRMKAEPVSTVARVEDSMATD